MLPTACPKPPKRVPKPKKQLKRTPLPRSTKGKPWEMCRTCHKKSGCKEWHGLSLTFRPALCGQCGSTKRQTVTCHHYEFRKPVKQKNVERIVRRTKEYSAHLRSAAFRLLREECFKRDGYRCRRCGVEAAFVFTNGKRLTRGLEVHHLTYVHVPNEHLADLLTLCTSCHRTTELTKGYRTRFLRGKVHAP